jgi:hypothetical protein
LEAASLRLYCALTVAEAAPHKIDVRQTAALLNIFSPVA